MIDSQVRVILGRKGQGKSYLAAWDLERRLDKKFIVIDYGLEHFGFSKARPNCWLVPIQESMIKSVDWPSLISRWHGIVVFPDRIRFDIFTQEIDRLMAAAFDVGNVVILAEEVQELAPTFGEISPGFCRIIDQGRKRRIDLIACSLKPADVNKRLIAQADDFVLFSIHEPNALDYLRRCGLPVDQLPTLQPHVALYYKPQTGETRLVRAGERRICHYG